MTLELTPGMATTNSLDRVWDALDRGGWKPNRRANTFKALCPVHGDANPSLSVRYDPQAGKIALHCFGCEASAADITAQLGLTVSDLFDAPLPADRRTHTRTPRPRRQPLPPRITREETTPTDDLTGAAWELVKSYDYVDDAGTAQQQVLREETTVNGNRHKRFVQRYRGANGRYLKRKPEGFAPLLYNLPAVTAAIATAGDVWLLEGEKDADNAIAAGLVATTNAGGATAFPAELVDRFRGGRVHLVVDNDQAGYKRAATLTAQLLKAGIEARAYLPDVTDRKGDFTDHLDAGGTVDTLVQITVDDAIALDAAAEAAKLIHQVEICLKEATAQLEVKGQERSVSERNAEAWARESAVRLERISSLQATIPDQLSERASNAPEEYSNTLTAAAEISRDTFTIAGLDTPAQVTALLPAPAAAPTVDSDATAAATDAVDKRTTTVKFGDSDTISKDGAGNGGTGGTPKFSGGGEPAKRAHIRRDEYDVVDGITVNVKWSPGAEDGEWEPKYYAVLNGWAEIQSVAVENDGLDTDIARAPHMIAIKFFRYARDFRGKPLVDEETNEIRIESALMKYSEEQLRDGSWAQALPWPNLIESTTRRGRDQAWDAIRKARPTATVNSVVYTTLGWRTEPEGSIFIHSTGAIGRDGAIEDIEVKPSLFNVFNLPAPSTDVDELRNAWQKGTLEAKDSWLVGRALAPLLAQSWGSVLKPNDATVHLVGGRASLKSAHGRLAVQFFAPEVHYRGVKEMLSGSAKGGSALGLIRSANTVTHLPLLVDDFAPDGNAKQAQNRLGELARMRFNSTGRKVSTQRGGVREDRPIEANLITTGELTAVGSADTRILNIPLHPQSVSKGRELFSRLESRSYRAARALLGSSLIQWVARQREELLEEIEQAIEGDIVSPLVTDLYWEQRLSDLPHDSGVRARLENIAVDLDRGIYIMLKMLRDYGVINKDEALEFYSWARDGIYEAAALQDSAASDAGEQLLAFIREAMIAGTAHLSDQHGNAPIDAASLGWIDQSMGEMPQWRPLGSRVGVIVGENEAARVYLIPSVAIGVANKVAAGADEVFSETSHSIASSFESHGWLTKDQQGKRSGGRRIGGQKIRVWDIPLSALLGGVDDESGPETDAPTPGPAGGPSLFDDALDTAPAPTAPQQPSTSADVEEEPPADEYPPVDPYADQPPADETTEAAAPVDEPADATPVDEEPAPSSAATSTTKTSTGKFRAAAAVLDVDGFWLPDGERIEITETISHLGQIALYVTKLNLGTQVTAYRKERGQIYITRAASIKLGIPFNDLPDSSSVFRYYEKFQEATKDLPIVTAALEAGYSVSGGGRTLSPSIEIWRTDNRDVGALIGFLPAMHETMQDTILADNPAPAVIADRMQRFADALHYPYRKTPSTTGLDLMFALHPHKEREALFAPCPRPNVLKEAGFEDSDLDWQRQLVGTELQHKWVHAYDRGASYPAAMAGVHVGIGDPTHHPEPLEFTNLPGYWKITIPEESNWLMPDVFTRQGRRGAATAGTIQWVSTPTMELAAELGIDVEIHEAYLWHTSKRLYESWANRVRDARLALDTAEPGDQAARDLLKKVYVSGPGIMASDSFREGRIGYTPHRYDHIIAKARANILRRIIKIGNDTGRWPVAVLKDTVIYTSDDADGIQSWPGSTANFGRGFGQYKYEGTAPLAEHTGFLVGKGEPYGGKSTFEELI